MNDKYTEAGRLLLGFLKQIAREKGLTDEQISERSGFIRPNVNRMFSGRYMPSLDNFIRLGEAIGVRVELHGPEEDPAGARIRNLNLPRFLFAPDADKEELYIIHTHYPACLIQVVQTIPASLVVVQNFDATDDFSEVLQEAMEYYRNSNFSSDLMN
jgi:transcriptional regulator with XRE-family HTH domain